MYKGLLPCKTAPFLFLWLERASFSRSLYCLQPLAFLGGWLPFYPVWDLGGRKETQGPHRLVITGVPRSLATALFFHLSESSMFLLYKTSRVFLPYLAGGITESIPAPFLPEGKLSLLDFKAGMACPPGSSMLRGPGAFAGHPVSGNGDSQGQAALGISRTPHLTQEVLINCLRVSKKFRIHLLIN